jgi:SAM-dependent methyltransferase
MAPVAMSDPASRANGLDEFLRPAPTHATISNFVPREAILAALMRELPSLGGTLLDIGCGRMPYRSLILAPPSRVTRYIGLDLRADLRHDAYNQFGSPDVEWDGRTMPFETASIDCAIATEVFMHCEDVESVMRETARVLKPGGRLFFTLPFFWAIHDAPRDQYRYTPFALQRHLGNAGFGDIALRAHGGWDASLAQMIGLWVGRRPMTARRRRVLSALAMPVMRFLLRKDIPPPLPDYGQPTMMITGIAGTATTRAATGI